MPADLVRRVHSSPVRGVLAITGGGTGAIGLLLSTPGASATVLEAVVPYSAAALAEWLGGPVERACDEAVARRMASRALARGRELDPDATPESWLGVGCTASLATDRPKRGEHRAFVAVQTATRTLVVSLGFEKGRRTRAEEEAAVAHAVVAALAHAAGVHTLDLERTPPGISARSEEALAPPDWTGLLAASRRIAPQAGSPSPGESPVCLFPGSFNPFHAGHAQIASLAATRTGRPVVCELSVTNVDKPPLDFLDVRRRLDGLVGRPVWLTAAPTFVEKAALAPGAVFAVGADTLRRIAEGRYYANDAARDAAFAEIGRLGCRFLVFGRERDGRFEGLDDLDVPGALRALCDAVGEGDFRVDVSSTTLRG